MPAALAPGASPSLPVPMPGPALSVTVTPYVMPLCQYGGVFPRPVYGAQWRVGGAGIARFSPLSRPCLRMFPVPPQPRAAEPPGPHLPTLGNGNVPWSVWCVDDAIRVGQGRDPGPRAYSAIHCIQQSLWNGFTKDPSSVVAIFASILLLKTLYSVVFWCFTLAILKVDVLELMTRKLY